MGEKLNTTGEEKEQKRPYGSLERAEPATCGNRAEKEKHTEENLDDRDEPEQSRTLPESRGPSTQRGPRKTKNREARKGQKTWTPWARTHLVSSAEDGVLNAKLTPSMCRINIHDGMAKELAKCPTISYERTSEWQV